jgi:hypothetical protein
MMTLSHYKTQLADMDAPPLTDVDALLLDHLRAALPAGAALDMTDAGPLAEAAAALLDGDDARKDAPLTVRVVAADNPLDVAAVAPDVLTLVGPVGTLAESAALRALALACDAAGLLLVPLHTLHPMAHGSTLAAVTQADGPAADALAALAAALETHYDFVEMAFENNRIQFAIKDLEMGVERAARRAPPPQPVQQPAAPEAHPGMTIPTPPGPAKRIYHTLVPLSLRLRLRDSRQGAVERMRGTYHRMFSLEMRLLLRELRWRLRNRDQ